MVNMSQLVIHINAKQGLAFAYLCRDGAYIHPDFQGLSDWKN